MPSASQTFGTPMVTSLAKFSVNFTFEGTSGDSLMSSLKRIALVYIVLNQIPDQALDELHETMNEIAEFYVSRNSYIPKVYPQPLEKDMKIENSEIRPTFQAIMD